MMGKADMIKKMFDSIKEAEKIAVCLSDESFKSWKEFGEVQNEKNEKYIQQAEILGGILNALDEIDTSISELKFYIQKEDEKND